MAHLASPGFELRGVGAGPVGAPRLVDVSLDISATGITVLSGVSGAGKSSLLRLLNGLDIPSEGTVRWDGQVLGELDITAHRREVGMVFQHPTVMPGSVADNLRVAAPELSGDEVADLLSTVALEPGLAQRNASTLSGGEKQRVCMARTLATSPKVVLADEPTASLDADAAAVIEDLALSLAAPGAHHRVGWVWVSHNQAQADRLADRTIVLDKGRVVSS